METKKIMVVVTRNETVLRTITVIAEDKEAAKSLLTKANLMLDRYISNTVIGTTLKDVDPNVVTVVTRATMDDKDHPADLHQLNLNNRVVDLLLFNNITSTVQLREMLEIQLASMSNMTAQDVRLVKKALMEKDMSFMSPYLMVM
jgi:hypothetical protein